MKTLIESYQDGLFQRQWWLPNLIAGIVVGVVALPLAMAFAIASGAKPEQGLYTAIVAGLLVSLFGGSRLQIAGPTGAFVVVLAGITNKYGIDGLQIATLMAGFLLVLFGITRLGAVIKYIPAPVILGFTAGIAVVIWVGQWPYFFGLPLGQGEHFHEKLWSTLHLFPELDLSTTVLGFISLIFVTQANRLPFCHRVPGPLIALVAATIVQSSLHLETVATIGSTFGGIPQGLPSFHLPHLSLNRVIELFGPAFAIAMLGAIESLLSAVVADGMAGTRHHSNRELIGQGIANIVSPLFGGFAATGAIARTATNIRNGGNSPLAGIIHALTLMLILLFLAPLAVDVPLTTLAAILFVVAWNMCDVKHVLKVLQRAPRSDILLLLITFILTVCVDLVIAVNIGITLSALHFLFKMANSVEIAQQTEEQLAKECSQLKLPQVPSDVMVYAIEGPFFFGAAERFEQALAITHTYPKTLIIRLKWVPFIDITALQTLEDIVRSLQNRKVRVMLCGANPNVEKKLRKAGFIDLLGIHNLFQEFPQALISCQPLPIKTSLEMVDAC